MENAIKPARLKTRRDFLRVQRRGSKSKGRLIVFMARTGFENNSAGRFGLVTPKSIGKAHDRNRIKRRLRHIIALFPELSHRQDIVLLASADCVSASFDELKNDVLFAGQLLSSRSRSSRGAGRSCIKPNQHSLDNKHVH